jgi:transcriptional regulator with XRE-family HTH domain
MPLSIAERKHLMPYGAQKEVAKELGVLEGYVSEVMNDLVHPKTATGKKKLRTVQVALSRKLRLPVDEVFPTEKEAAPEMARAS